MGSWQDAVYFDLNIRNYLEFELDKGRGSRLSVGYKLVVRQDPKSPAAEAIRSLRTNLQYVGVDRSLKSVLVTSAGPSEGKTSIAANLALSMADAGTKCIAVGVDLRKPSLHSAFGLSNSTGLTNVLLGQMSLKDALQETEHERLSILASGPVPPNPAELLGSSVMKEIIAEIEASCDMAIYDATPVMAVTDAVLLSRLMSGVLLIVDMNQTPREQLALAKAQLEKVDAHILGVVANRVKSGGRYGGYYYYYYGEGESEAAATGDGAGSRAGRWLGRLMGGRRRT